jgi:hypothetical protein
MYLNVRRGCRVSQCQEVMMCLNVRRGGGVS